MVRNIQILWADLFLDKASVHVLSTGVRVHRDLVYAYTLGPLRIPT